jgi:hypothetical protein
MTDDSPRKKAFRAMVGILQPRMKSDAQVAAWLELASIPDADFAATCRKVVQSCRAGVNVVAVMLAAHREIIAARDRERAEQERRGSVTPQEAVSWREYASRHGLNPDRPPWRNQ